MQLLQLANELRKALSCICAWPWWVVWLAGFQMLERLHAPQPSQWKGPTGATGPLATIIGRVTPTVANQMQSVQLRVVAGRFFRPAG